MKKILASLVLSAALVAGAATIATAPANAAGVYVSVGGGHHWHHHRSYYRPVYHHRYYHRPVVAIGVGPYFWHGRHYSHRYSCSRHWCYR